MPFDVPANALLFVWLKHTSVCWWQCWDIQSGAVLFEDPNISLQTSQNGLMTLLVATLVRAWGVSDRISFTSPCELRSYHFQNFGVTLLLTCCDVLVRYFLCCSTRCICLSFRTIEVSSMSPTDLWTVSRGHVSFASFAFFVTLLVPFTTHGDCQGNRYGHLLVGGGPPASVSYDLLSAEAETSGIKTHSPWSWRHMIYNLSFWTQPSVVNSNQLGCLQMNINHSQLRSCVQNTNLLLP